MIYYALSNMDLAVSRDKKKVRRFAKSNLRFAGRDLQLGCCSRQVFRNKESFQEEFGECLIYDIDQGLVFRPNFSLVRSL